MSKLVEAAAEFLKGDFSGKQPREVNEAMRSMKKMGMAEEVEDDQLFIELLSANTFNSLSEEDQDRYLEALEKLDEISVETMKSAKEKLGKKAFNASYDDNKRAAQKFAQRAMAMGSRIARKQRQTNT